MVMLTKGGDMAWVADLNEQHRIALDEIRQKTICDHDFKCLDGDVCQAAPVHDIGLEDYVECLADHNGCRHSFPFGFGRLCRCRVRIYLAHHHLV